MEKIKQLEEQLSSMIQTQLCNPEHVDAKELGEVVDMLKDLSEFCYYKTITEAMEESTKEKAQPMYYSRPMEDYGRMYYGGNQGSSSMNGSRMYTTPSYRNPVYFEERMYDPMYMMNDPREGRSRQSRRMYMESKEMHKDANTQMKELEQYIKDLGEDITEMIKDATPTEKQVLQQKIATLATKIV